MLQYTPDSLHAHRGIRNCTWQRLLAGEEQVGKFDTCSSLFGTTRDKDGMNRLGRFDTCSSLFGATRDMDGMNRLGKFDSSCLR